MGKRKFGSWLFLELVVRKFGFHDEWIILIKECFSMTMCLVLVNGSATRYSLGKQGLRQGDPLSPYLFILIIEALGRSISTALVNGRIEGIKPTTLIPSITHQQFADDTLVSLKSSAPKACELKCILDLYKSATGQKVNYVKSKLYFIHTPKVLQARLARIFGCGVKDFPATYLGMPLFKGRMIEAMWALVIERISKKFVGWRGALLSQVGKAQLVKACLQNISVYFMAIFKMPISVCNKIGKVQRDFLWSSIEEKKRMSLLACDGV